MKTPLSVLKYWDSIYDIEKGYQFLPILVLALLGKEIAMSFDRKLLASFLRTRRESIDPQRLGLPRAGRRRTPGLRREEVAMLANVGVTWYTWLEQGREMNPSSSVLSAISRALQCTPAETRHMFILAGLPTPESPLFSSYPHADSASLKLLEALMPHPASLQKPNFDIIGYNQNYCSLMGVDLEKIPDDERNCIYLFLANSVWRNRFRDQSAILRLFVAYFRSGMVEYRGDPRWDQLLERFLSISDNFYTLWKQQYEIRGIENHIRQFSHPKFGDFIMQQMNWFSAPRDGLRLLVYIPLDAQGENVVKGL